MTGRTKQSLVAIGAVPAVWMMSMWYVYVVRCADRSLYTGITTDADRRIARHNLGHGARYTRTRRPVRLVYLEQATDRGAALRREYEIKQLTTAEKRRLVAARRGRKRATRRS